MCSLWRQPTPCLQESAYASIMAPHQAEELMADPPGDMSTDMDMQDQSHHVIMPHLSQIHHAFLWQSILASLPSRSPSPTGGRLPTHRLHICNLYALQAVFGLRMWYGQLWAAQTALGMPC